MNKLIIIGNGFDLAHKLPTSYKSFINFIWSKLISNYNDKLFSPLVTINKGYISLFHDENCTCYNDFYDNVKNVIEKENYKSNRLVLEKSKDAGNTFSIYYKNDTHNKPSRIPVFNFNNKFFEYITIQNIDYWVDIENAYYKMLVDLAKGNKSGNITSIEQLNEEFKQIRDLLQYYLENEVDSKIVNNTHCIRDNSIIDIFEYQYKGLSNNKSQKYFNEFSPELHERLIEFDENIYNYDSYISKEKLFQYLFLDFNYTSNIKNYVNIINSKASGNFGFAEHIQIHGNLYDKNNTINFGFGDEMDDSYKILENIGDNKYLENIKSFLYLNNSNYRKLLNWIENDDFQVLILGHSCGLSDRTLLNTIFEHSNCRSIKVYYYKNSANDNFKELTQNISRHFNKKALMRKKLVDKSLCSELPQDCNYT